MPISDANADEDFKNLQVIVFAMRPERLALFEEIEDSDSGAMEVDEAVEFIEPVDSFEHSRNQPLLCLITDENKKLRHIAKGNRGYRAGTSLAQVKLSHSHKIPNPFSLQKVFQFIPKRFSNRVLEAFEDGGLLPLKTSHSVIQALLNVYPNARSTIDKSLRKRTNPLLDLSRAEQFAFQQQREAVLLSLQIAGLDRKQHLQFQFDPDRPPKCYLEGLGETRLREDSMIFNDLSVLPGFKEIRRFVYNAVQFTDNKTNLTILLANRTPLETLIGTDLIYYNASFQAFVMVQYKAMEVEGNEPVFRIPNPGLDIEIDNMTAFFKELGLIPGDVQNTPSGFRLSHNPFFLKFCPRVVNEPESVDLTPGMYFPLSYWSRLAAGPDLSGPQGGKALRYDNAGRYFNNSDFVSLVRKAWVGTHLEHSVVIEKIVRHIIESGKSVTLAHVRQR